MMPRSLQLILPAMLVVFLIGSFAPADAQEVSHAAPAAAAVPSSAQGGIGARGSCFECHEEWPGSPSCPPDCEDDPQFAGGGCQFCFVCAWGSAPGGGANCTTWYDCTTSPPFICGYRCDVWDGCETDECAVARRQIRVVPIRVAVAGRLSLRPLLRLADRHAKVHATIQ